MISILVSVMKHLMTFKHLAFVAAVCAVATSQSAYVLVKAKTHEMGLDILNGQIYTDPYNSGYWMGARPAEGNTYEVAARLYTQYIMGYMGYSHQETLTFDRRLTIVYEIEWIPETPQEEANGPVQGGSSFWNAKVAHWGRVEANSGWMGTGFTLVTLQDALMPSTTSIHNLMTIDPTYDFYSTFQDSGTPPLNSYLFGGTPVFVDNGSAFAGSGVTWSFVGGKWIGEATLEVLHAGQTVMETASSEDAAAYITSCHWTRYTLEKIGGYDVLVTIP